MTENQDQYADERPPSTGNELAHADTASDGQASGRQTREELRVSTRKELLFKLDQMPGLVATGLLSTARANAMRSIYQTMLSNLNDSSAGGATAIANEDLVAMLHGQPALLKLVTPFLTPDQLDLIVREAPK